MPLLAAAVGNDYFVSDYVMTQGDVSEYELMDALYETGFTPGEYDDNIQVEL